MTLLVTFSRACWNCSMVMVCPCPKRRDIVVSLKVEVRVD
jgi:hypothetical protein